MRHLLVCVADHFEPFNRTLLPDGTITGGVSDGEAQALVAHWCNSYRTALGSFRDADGCTPRHTFFYPWDEYDPGCLGRLATFCRAGHGEVEIHLHHRNDTEAGLKQKLVSCRDAYAQQHGLLGTRPVSRHHAATGGAGDLEPAYAFVHGNWCLCNARPDGDWCGVDRELGILADTGCYADLTFPSAPSATQTRCVNTIYYGEDPRAGERGPRMRGPVSCTRKTDDHASIMMIPGPLGLNWRSRKWGLVPRLENAELSGVNPATRERLGLWQRIGVHVPGRPEWVAVKLHTHGAVRGNQPSIFGEKMVAFHRVLAEACAEAQEWQLHYVTARELFNIMKAAERGCDGEPGGYRDLVIGAPRS
jgi:hypothetical protein